MSRRREILIFLGLFVLGLPPASDAGSQQTPPADPLPKILEKAQAYCNRLERISLFFVCREEIDELQFDPPIKLFGLGQSSRKTHVSLEYDYQLVRSDAAVDEKRVLLKENGRPRNVPNAPLKTKLYKHRNLLFGPVGLLGEYWQPRHVYRYLGEDTFDNEKVFLIEALPAGDPSPELLYGKVWIRAKDFAIVKIEWDPRSLGGLEAVQRMAQRIGRDAAPRISIVGVFGVEKNGIRFLSHLAVHEDYDSRMGIYRASQTEIRYTAYRFFIVETEVRY